MQAEDRIIHFSVELLHQPMAPNKESLQKLYFELSQTKAAYDSTDFTNPGQVKFYSRRDKKTQSLAIFMPDRVVLMEEWTDIPLNTFLEKIREVGGRALAARGVPKYLAHTVMIRSTFALTHWDDARSFLLDHVCGQDDRIEPHFKRPVSVGGMRYVLPETDENPGMYNVLIESFRHSKNEIFVEVKGIFSRQQLSAEEIPVVVENMRAVREFISQRVYPYLDQYDRPRDAELE